MTIDELIRLRAVRAAAAEGEAKRIRIDAGLSLAEMASAVGVDRMTISAWEDGKRAPRAKAALRYAEVLARLDLDSPSAEAS